MSIGNVIAKCNASYEMMKILLVMDVEEVVTHSQLIGDIKEC